MHGKVLRSKGCHTTWSLKGKLSSVEHLKEHSMHIAQDSTRNNKIVEEFNSSLPMRKNFTTLGNVTIDVKAKNEEDVNNTTIMNEKRKEIRSKLAEDGTRDEMKLRQPNYDPALQSGLKIKHVFRYANNNDEDNEIIEWCAGKIVKVINSIKLENTGKGDMFHRKDGDVEVTWDDNMSTVEEISFTIV